MMFYTKWNIVPSGLDLDTGNDISFIPLGKQEKKKKEKISNVNQRVCSNFNIPLNKN